MFRRFALAAAALAAVAAVLILRQPAEAARAPQAADVQAAYDAAATESGKLHTFGLKILGVKCDPAAKGRYSCEVGFSAPGLDPERVYLDAALVEPRPGGWRLLSGLCKRYG